MGDYHKYTPNGSRNQRLKTIEERFWEKVDKSGDCWLWLGQTNGGYGVISCNGKDKYAHRVSWQIHNGNIPGDILVLHTCDNPPCVNPDHLWLGTDADNTNDKVKKNRHLCGSSQPNSKLHESDVLVIRELWSVGTSKKAIAWLFDIAEGTAYQIAKRTSWRHI